jgi:hypothetical protein
MATVSGTRAAGRDADEPPALVETTDLGPRCAMAEAVVEWSGF